VSFPIELGDTWTVSSVRPSPTGNVVYEVVTNSLQRLHVTVPYAQTGAGQPEIIIQRTIDALGAPGKPLF